MTGESVTIACDQDRHDDCKDDMYGYKGEHVPCECKCHK